MKQPLSIPREQSGRKSLDYSFLRKEGIRHLQSLSGDIWTDYNDHDPGVTILEQLCFALTDVSYRSGFEIERLLQASHTARSDTFFEASEILPCNPVTLLDFRKLIIDRVNGVRNAWIEPVKDDIQGIKGVYKVRIQVDDDFNTPEEIESIKSDAKVVLNRHRNLGEDFETIEVLDRELISISASINIAYDVMGENVLGKILAELEEYLSPSIRFHTMEELLEEGNNINDIFDGPLPKHGFIKGEDLKPLHSEIQISKLIEILSTIEGVTAVKSFTVSKNGIPVYGDVIRMDTNKMPVLDTYLDTSPDRIELIRFYRGDVRYEVDLNTANQIYVEHSTRYKKGFYQTSSIIKKLATHAQVPSNGIDHYYSLQRGFPKVYGIGEFGIARKQGKKKMGLARQLKAYLLIFEQLLANYLSQLTNIKSLFSIDEDLEQSYFQQPPFDVPDIEVIIKNPKPGSFKEQMAPLFEDLKRHAIMENVETDLDPLVSEFEKQAIESGFDVALDEFIEKLQNETKKKARFQSRINAFRLAAVREAFKKNLADLLHDMDPFTDRRNRFLDHLLARFGETYIEEFTGRLQTFQDQTDLDSTRHAKTLSKIRFLRSYVDLSRNRAKGYNYTLATTDQGNTSGLRKRACILMNIPDKTALKLSEKLANSKVRQFSRKKEDIKKDTGFVSQEENERGLPFEFTSLPAPTERSLDAEPPPDIKRNFVFHSSSKDILYNLLAHGIYSYNYKVHPNPRGRGKSFIVTYKDPVNHIPIKVYQANSERKAYDSIGKLVDYLRELNRDTEGFYLIEHILLRPVAGDKFRFNLFDESNNILLTSYEADDKISQEFITDNILITGTKVENYAVRLEKSGEGLAVYSCILYDDKGKPIAKTAELYESEGTAEKAISEIINYLHSLIKRNILGSRLSLFVQTKKGYEFDGDLYSNQFSIVLPAWPARFQNPDFKKYFKQLINTSAPAHLAINYFWLGLEDMRSFEDALEAWQTQKSKKRSNNEKLDELSYTLMRLIQDMRIKQNASNDPM